jgi:hypothetical protein
LRIAVGMARSFTCLAVGLQTVAELVQKLADKRAANRVSHVAQAPAELAQALAVHSSGDCGSPRVSGSTSARRSSSQGGLASVSLSGLRPPPGRRTRSGSGVSSARNSASPRPIVLRAMPVARVTALTPPCPADLASAAANRRRPRSSSTGASASKRWRIADSSITPE